MRTYAYTPHTPDDEACEACAISYGVPSAIVAHLAAMPEPELRAMQSKSEAERTTVQQTLSRVEVELAQIAEALELKARRSSPKSAHRTARRPDKPGATQKRILDAVARLPQPVSPAEIIAEMESHGVSGNRGTIHNAIARLLKTGALERPEAGQYQLASRNGSSGESHTGPTENEPTGPPLTAAEAQEAS